MDQMQRHICGLQLSRMLGAHRTLSFEHQSALLTALALHYKHGNVAHGKQLLSTDLGPADAYALLAAHLSCDLARSKRESRYLLVALALLDGLLEQSPSNFHGKLLALRIDHEIGNTLGAQEMYHSLDVKHLQLDSLGYVHYARMPTSGLISSCPALYDHACSFFSANYKDSSDHLTFSYKYGSFLKLEEFMDFRQRLHDSFHYAQTESDRVYAQLLECQTTDALRKLTLKPRDDFTACAQLRDNYDLKVYADWDAFDDEKAEESRRVFFESSKKYLDMRRRLVECLDKAVKLTSTNDDDSLRLDLERSLSDWSAMGSEGAEALPDWPVSRWEAGRQTPYFDVVGNLMKLLTCAENVENANVCVENLKCGLCEMNSLIKHDDYLPARRKTMEIVVNCVEFLSISSLVCGLLCDSTRTKSSSCKKGKKKSVAESAATSQTSFSDSIREGVRAVAEATESFGRSVDAWHESCRVGDVAGLCAALSLRDGNVASADKAARDTLDSFARAHKETRALLHQKHKFLHALLTLLS